MPTIENRDTNAGKNILLLTEKDLIGEPRPDIFMPDPELSKETN
jgi:hypothetical protein